MAKHPLSPVIRAVSLGACPLEPVDRADPFLGSCFPRSKVPNTDRHQSSANRFSPSYPLTTLENTTYKLDATTIILPTSYPFRDALPDPTSSFRCTNLPMLYLWHRSECQVRHFLRPYVHQSL
jgi:hypothetical protein